MSNENASGIDPSPLVETTRSAATRSWLLLHALASVIAIAVNAIVDIADGGGWRVHWLVFGWGIGLASHAALVIWRVRRDRHRTSWQPGAQSERGGRAFAPPTWPEERRP